MESCKGNWVMYFCGSQDPTGNINLKEEVTKEKCKTKLQLAPFIFVEFHMEHPVYYTFTQA